MAADLALMVALVIPAALLVAAVVNDHREWRARMRRREGFR